MRLAETGHARLSTSAAVIAQVWRGGRRQARLSKFRDADLMLEVPLDAVASRRIGILAAALGTADVIDGHVALLALERDATVITSDRADIECWGVDRERIVEC